MRKQGTIAHPVSLHGRGFILDRETALKLSPAEASTGFRFVRTDLQGQPSVTAHPRYLRSAPNCTVLEDGDARVMVVEHLLAACWALGVSNLIIEVDAPEIPTLDGSALPFAEKLESAGIITQDATIPQIALHAPVVVSEDGGKLLIAFPAGSFRLSYLLHYPDLPEVGTDFLVITGELEQLRRELLPARTFIPEQEARRLLQQGLIRSTDESMGVVIHPGHTPQMRLPHELVRHKILDLLGDLAILGCEFRAQFLGIMSGHHLNARLIQALAARYPHH
ncbi:MAG: hypothetical protein B1H03_05630 [Planctomycetales bacterium 4484_113]|nr:MAG: hypothetical protein B1H03_05630 [Planctomycetales bacterium 4484_113]